MSRGRRRLAGVGLIAALAAPIALIGPALADPGDATARTAARLVSRALGEHACGDVVVRGHHLGRVDCRGARDGVGELTRAVARELPAAVCGDLVVQDHHLGRVDCRGARDGIEDLERAVLRELRDLVG